jgi:pimeloyl-ACP methyl ester carboxylesterase
MEPHRREITATDGTTVSYLVFDGEAPAAVILHGLAGSSREFLPTAQSLRDRKVVVVDQRGHGHSTRIPVDTTRAAFVDDVARIIEAERIGPVDLVGQSMGAHTAMLVAACYPELVRRLVLLEGNEGGGSEADSAALGDYFRGWPVPFVSRADAVIALGDGSLARAWIADLETRADGLYPRFDAEVMAAISSGMVAPRWQEWETVTAPTLVLYAENGMFTEDQKSRFVSGRPGVTRVDLAGASHDAHLDAFESWITAIRGFLDRP